MVYCQVHRRLSNVRRMCESCLLSFAIEGKSSGDVVKSFEGILTVGLDSYAEGENKICMGLKAGEENLNKVEQHRCCCCRESLADVTLCFANATDLSNALVERAGAAMTLAQEDVPRSPPPPSEMPVKKNEESMDVVPLPHIKYTELKLMSDNESDVPEGEDGSTTPSPDAKAVTVPLLMEYDESNEDICRAPRVATMKSPRILAANSLKESYGRPPRSPKTLLVEQQTLPNMDALEINGGSDADVLLLERQVELDKSSLAALYMELDEERSASTVAANQAMAMITRLQAEKAAVQMEALQYQRMMEEQAEFDQQALQFLKDLLIQREEEIEVLEAELQSYRERTTQSRKVLDLEKCKAWADVQYRKLTTGSSSSVSEKSNCDDIPANLDEESNIYGTVKHLFDQTRPSRAETEWGN